MRWLLPVLLLCISLSGCGYRFGECSGTLPCRYSTISVPYVEGDQNGSLTAAIVKEIARSGAFTYQCNGALILKVVVLDVYEDNIGFRYDRRKRGTLTKDTIPTETRLTIVVDVSVVEAASCCTILGPVHLAASIDYDHDYYSSRDGINIFSLGQLSDLDEAYDAAQTPLNRVIAQKIVDYISQSW